MIILNTLFYLNHKQIPIDWLQWNVLPSMLNVLHLPNLISISNPSENLEPEHLPFFPRTKFHKAELHRIFIRNQKSQEHQVKYQGDVVVLNECIL